MSASTKYSPGVAEAFSYAEGGLADRIPPGRLVHLACERFLRDYDEAGTNQLAFWYA